MEYKRCARGHFYDPEQYSTCPDCAREGAGRSDEKVDIIGSTVPADDSVPGGGSTSYGSTEPLYTGYFGGNGGSSAGRTIGVTVPDDSGRGPTDYGQTEPITPPDFKPAGGNGRDALNGQFRPVVGWLVCIDGPSRGRDYRVHSQNNWIGRAKHMDICITDDKTISAEKMANLAYDDRNNRFYFVPGQGTNLVYVNGETVFQVVEIKAYDELMIGSTTLLFIPFCGDRFRWGEKFERNI